MLYLSQHQCKLKYEAQLLFLEKLEILKCTIGCVHLLVPYLVLTDVDAYVNYATITEN